MDQKLPSDFYNERVKVDTAMLLLLLDIKLTPPLLRLTPDWCGSETDLHIQWRRLCFVLTVIPLTQRDTLWR